MTATTFQQTDQGLTRTLQFRDFREAFRFLNEVVEIAEAAQHHPDIQVMYSKVVFTLRTHDAGNAVTDQDRNLAREIDAAYEKFASHHGQ